MLLKYAQLKAYLILLYIHLIMLLVCEYYFQEIKSAEAWNVILKVFYRKNDMNE